MAVALTVTQPKEHEAQTISVTGLCVTTSYVLYI